MSSKIILAWGISLALLMGLSITLFIIYKNELQQSNLVSQAPAVNVEDYKTDLITQGFDHVTDEVRGTILDKTLDEDGKPALKLYISWPPSSPVYDKNFYTTLNCSPLVSNLVVVEPSIATGGLRKENVVERGINVYELAEKGDVLKAYCLNEYCTEMGGNCILEKINNDAGEK